MTDDLRVAAFASTLGPCKGADDRPRCSPARLARRDGVSIEFIAAGREGRRRMFPLVREAMANVMPVERLRFVAFSHWEPDESGALNEWLQAAPEAIAVQGRVGMQVCVGDQAMRPGRALGDGEVLSLGKKKLAWIEPPHLPHGWDCGFMFESTTTNAARPRRNWDILRAARCGGS